MGSFIQDGAAALPAVKSDARAPSIPPGPTEWAAGDANKLRQASLDLRSNNIALQQQINALGSISDALMAQANGSLPMEWVLVGTGTDTVFDIPGASAGVSVMFMVAVDGIVQQAVTDYITDATNEEITFTDAPPYGSTIQIRQLGNTRPVAQSSDALVEATGSTELRSLADRFGEILNVNDFGADPTGVADSTTAIQAAVTAATYKGRVAITKGTYKVTSAITLPMGSNGSFMLVLDAGAVVNYSGSGYCFDAATAGTPYANVSIVGQGEIVGTSAGLAGIRYHAFNRGSIQGVRVRGFTNGDGIFIEGANTIDMISVEVSGNKNGIHLRRCRDGADYGVNACRVLGGHVANNTQWGIFDDASGTGVNGNASNFYAATVEYNGGTGAGTGNVFIQAGDNHTVACYLEYDPAVNLSPYNIVLGDGSNHPIGTRVVGCMMASGGVGAAVLGSIYDNGTGTLIEGNFEAASVPAVVVGGAGGSQRIVMGNTGYAVAVHGGTDNGDTLTIGKASGLLAQVVPGPRGVGFRSVTGTSTEPFRVRLHDAAGTRIADFFNDGDRAASVAVDGKIMPGIGSGSGQSNGIYMGIGVPNDAHGIDGDWYLRCDSYNISGERVYIKGGTWHGVL